ncbi:MAG: hypothetical protein GPJ54_19650 [Candidatus Heimdallarchaeota archaeon]|nr:hypothetical protein [Candidatus Heimdallarchaeota archaeon]
MALKGGKKIRTKILLIMITTILVSGSSGSTIPMETAKPDYFNGSTTDFSVDIYSVSAGDQVRSDGSNRVPLSQWGTVDYVTDTPFTLFSVMVNVTGFLFRNFGIITYNETTVDLGNNSLIYGQMYSILDGQVNAVTQPYLTSNGLLVTVPLGDHTLTVVYISMDEQGNYYYATDSIVFRVRETNVFPAYIRQYIALELIISDLYEDKEISGDVISIVSGFSSPQGVYDRNIVFTPIVETSTTFNGSVLSNDDELVFVDKLNDKLDVRVSTNSTGFNDLQIYEKWNSTEGLNFLLDASGMHEIDDNLVSVSVRDGNNYIGVITLAPYGLWHRDIPYPVTGDLLTDPDWDSGMQYITNESVSDGSETFRIDAAFDFIYGISGVNFRAAVGERSTSAVSEGPINVLWALLPLTIFRRRRKN